MMPYQNQKKAYYKQERLTAIRCLEYVFESFMMPWETKLTK